MATAKDNATVTSEVSKDLKAELDERAKAEERTRSSVIARAIRFYIDYAELVPASADRPRPKGKK